MDQSPQQSAIQSAVIRKAFFRLMPILLLAYVLAYLDRVNISFAALTMREDLGLTAQFFGMGAGLFFLGYFLFEIPSNIFLTKVGARRWISRIMITWGAISACMAFVTGDVSFVVLRFLLGAAEAGFFPGIILYLTFWFPKDYRSRIIAVFMLSIPLSLAVGAPISTALLGLDGTMGLHGWQWLFIIEGVPTVLVGILFLMIMPDTPKDAKWLTEAEKSTILGILEAEKAEIAKKFSSNASAALKQPIIWVLAFVYISNVTANIGLSSFLPLIIKEHGDFTNMQIGWITSIPYFVGVVGSLLFGFLSDKFKIPFTLLFIAISITGLGLIGAGYMYSQAIIALAIVAISMAGIGIYGFKAPFWTLPSLFLTGAAAATGIALINSVGNLGGFIGPVVIGWIRESTGSYAYGLYFLGSLSVLASIVSLFLVRRYKDEAK